MPFTLYRLGICFLTGPAVDGNSGFETFASRRRELGRISPPNARGMPGVLLSLVRHNLLVVTLRGASCQSFSSSSPEIFRSRVTCGRQRACALQLSSPPFSRGGS